MSAGWILISRNLNDINGYTCVALVTTLAVLCIGSEDSPIPVNRRIGGRMDKYATIRKGLTGCDMKLYLMSTLSLPFCVLLCGAVCAGDDDAQLPEYTIHRAGTPIKIDGKLDEPAWVAAPDVGEFHFTWYKSGKKERTVARMLWDDEYLYVAHICEDDWITARCMEHDGPVAQDDCFEVMIAPNVGRPNVYFNIEWNVLGAWVDNHRPHGPNKPKAPVWDADGVRIAGTHVGTLNDDSDEDRYWIAEVAVPFRNFAHIAAQTPPQPGYLWNLNLNRHGGDTNLQYSQWSRADTPAPSFHTPHRFGRVVFSDRTSPFGRSEESD